MNGQGEAVRSIVLSLQLRPADSSASASGVSWNPDAPAAALVIDVIRASGGAPASPEGAVLDAQFPDIQSALLAVRRVRWALEGVAESAGCENVTACMAVYQVEDPAAGKVPLVLERASPGVVFLSPGIAEAVQELPSAMLRATTQSGWRELAWRGSETRVAFADDEQSLLALIRGLGREDPWPPAPEAPPAAVETVAAQDTGTSAPAESLGRSVLEPEPESGAGKFKWLIVGGAAAIVVLFAGLLIPAIVSGGHGKPSAPPPTAPTKETQTPEAQKPAVTPDTQTTKPPISPSSGTAEIPKNPDQAPKTVKKPKADAKTEPAIQNIPAGSCDLTEADIARSLNRASSYMYAGRLTESEGIFQRLLSCPSARQKASEGLKDVQRRKAAQSPDTP